MSQVELQKKLLATLAEKYGDKIISSAIEYDMPIIEIDPSLHGELHQWLKEDDEWAFRHFLDITAVDRIAEGKFVVVVHLRSHPLNLKIRIKTTIERDKPELPSLLPHFIGATWSEREVYDLMGITFTGHPRMTRILNPDDFEGHPLQKDFPVKGMHRGSFPKGSVISNKKAANATSLMTHSKPLDQLLPNTPIEQQRQPMKEKEAGDA